MMEAYKQLVERMRIATNEEKSSKETPEIKIPVNPNIN